LAVHSVSLDALDKPDYFGDTCPDETSALSHSLSGALI
jgi:hypothetical protein